MARDPPWKQNGLLPMVNIMQLDSAGRWSEKRRSHQPAFMDSCLNTSHTCLPSLPSRSVSPCVLCPPLIGLVVAPLTFFLCMESMALVLWRVGVILGSGYGMQGQSYVTLLL